MQKSILLCLSLLLVGCSSTSSRKNIEPFYTKLFEGTYDDVWVSALKSLNDYPLKTSNKDSGKIQTESINGPYNENLFTYPDYLENSERYRFGLRVQIARVNPEQRRSLVRVRVIKDLERFQDFYAGWLAYQADGLEEKLLLYRIEHLLQIEKRINRDTTAEKK